MTRTGRKGDAARVVGEVFVGGIGGEGNEDIFRENDFNGLAGFLEIKKQC